jgi:curved DNA-binding protein CbpA
MSDPFTVLGVDENAGDEEIKRRYLALVRAYPPDLEPERFQAYRAAYDSLCDHRSRLAVLLLGVNDAALTRLKLSCLATASPLPGRPSKAAIDALLIEGIEKPLPDDVPRRARAG